ncbi:MAG: hypothetical protein AB8G99_06655 [Planctomycetaceae bacterium]
MKLLRVTTACVLVATTLPPAAAIAQQEVVLKSGMVLKGRAFKSKALSSDRSLQGPGDTGQYRRIDLRYKHYFAPHRLVASVSPGDVFKKESFKLKHRTISKKRIPDFIGGFNSVTPWDNSGVRTITLRTPSGPIRVTQAIERLTPDYVWVRSLNYNWQYGIPTTSVSPQVLDRVLRQAIDMTDPQDRIKACRYLMNVGKLQLADKWVTETQAEFPAFNDACEAATLSLRQLFAKQLIAELIERKRAGQHKLVQESLANFPQENLPTDVLNSVAQLKKEYESKKIAIDVINDQLEQLESALDAKLIAKVRPIRSELQSRLNFASLERLEAYMNLAKDQTLKPEERLSIAFSGWLLGSSNATTNLPETIGLWSARDFVASYLESDDPLARRRATDELSRLEGATPRTIAQLLKTSPPLLPSDAQPGQFVTFTVQTPNGSARYKVMLPPEYSEYQTYPMIIALKQSNQASLDAPLSFWAGTPQQQGQGQRRGYIVIAPDYDVPNADGYESNARSHEVVLAAMRDAFRQFSVDTDRVFLAGHGTGADAAYDIGMSHPDIFAGIIPICGYVGPESSKLTTNGSNVPWYVVTGEKHLSLAHNAFVLHQIAITKRNEDVLVCEYHDRGFESYYDEIQNLFQWMDFYRRDDMPQEFEVATVRPENNRFYWVEANGFKANLKNQDFARGNKPNRLRSVEFSLRVTSTNSIQVKRSGAEDLTLRLMDGVVDFNKSIRVTGSGVSRGTRIDPQPSIEDVLEDYRLYRDRNRIALQRVRL